MSDPAEPFDTGMRLLAEQLHDAGNPHRERAGANIVDKLMADSHRPPCKPMTAIYGGAAVVSICMLVLLGLLSWTANRAINDYDKRLEKLTVLDEAKAASIQDMHLLVRDLGHNLQVWVKESNNMQQAVADLRKELGQIRQAQDDSRRDTQSLRQEIRAYHNFQSAP